MVKKEEKVVKNDSRTEAWEAFLANYEKENPVKFAAKKKAGEFNEIPASFRG